MGDTMMLDLLKKHVTQLLNHLFVGLMAYGMNISPLEASVLFKIVERHHDN